MSGLVQIGDRLVTVAEMIPLLIGYELFPQFCRHLIIDQAIAAVECSEEERDRALQEYCEAHQLTNSVDRQQWHARTGITPPQLIALATRNLRVAKFKQATWGHKLEAYFLTYKAQLDQVTYSLIRTAWLAQKLSDWLAILVIKLNVVESANKDSSTGKPQF